MFKTKVDFLSKEFKKKRKFEVSTVLMLYGEVFYAEHQNKLKFNNY